MKYGLGVFSVFQSKTLSNAQVTSHVRRTVLIPQPLYDAIYLKSNAKKKMYYVQLSFYPSSNEMFKTFQNVLRTKPRKMTIYIGN